MIWFIIIGVVCGFITGIGIGGGTLLIPALTMFFGVTQRTAQSVNLIYYIPTGIAALIMHIKNRSIERKGLWQLILFGVIFAVIGSFAAANIEDEMLRKIFGGFLLVMGINELRGKIED